MVIYFNYTLNNVGKMCPVVTLSIKNDMHRYRDVFPFMGLSNLEIIIFESKQRKNIYTKKIAPNVGLEPTTLRLRV